MRFLSDVKKYMNLAMYMAESDLRTEVSNSYLNWVWWVLQPMMEMFVYTIVFKRVFGNSDRMYAAFVYSGLVMWTFFTRSISSSVGILRANREIITKVYIPKHVLLLANLVGNLFKMALGLAVMIPLYIILDIKVTWAMVCIVPIIAVFFVFTFAVSTVLMHFGVFVDDLSYIVSILLNILMFASGIFYDIETVLTGNFLFLVKWFNPVAAIMKQMRNAMLYGIWSDWMVLLMWLLLAAVVGAVGIRLIYKNENTYVKVI